MIRSLRAYWCLILNKGGRATLFWVMASAGRPSYFQYLYFSACRDLSRPVGALNEARLELFRERFKEMPEGEVRRASHNCIVMLVFCGRWGLLFGRHCLGPY